MSQPEKKRRFFEYDKEDTAFERVILFTDAVVAIAITLLALDLRLELPEDHVLTFHDLLEPWRNYLAFGLSFINIASFWQNHHYIFSNVRKIDARLMGLNTSWLFFIVTLPFCTTLVSAHFNNTPAIFLYCLNITVLSFLQNFMWRYAASKEGYMTEHDLFSKSGKRVNVVLALDIVNGLIAIGVSFFYPIVAFIFLFTKVPMFILSMLYIRALQARRAHELQQRKKEQQEKESA
ncbi:MAG: TMEM175 family protein [Bacteroidota bacterium]